MRDMKTKVTHPKFGNGIVTNQDSENVTVDFNGEVKTLITKFARLTNEDGTPFGEQFEAKPKTNKKTKFEKDLQWERSLTEDQKRELRFENADGSRNWDAYNKFLERQSQKKWESIGQ